MKETERLLHRNESHKQLVKRLDAVGKYADQLYSQMYHQADLALQSIRDNVRLIIDEIATQVSSIKNSLYLLFTLRGITSYSSFS